MTWCKVSKNSFTKLAKWLGPGEVGDIIAQCFIVYESGVLEIFKDLDLVSSKMLYLF